MMNVDFDKIIPRRNTNSIKWDGMASQFGSDDLLPLWIADMDFACPDVILNALCERLEHPILGYSFPPESCYEAVIDKAYNDYNWEIEKEWIVFTDGIVKGIYNALLSFAVPGDNVIIQEPAYFSFFNIISSASCRVNANHLVVRGGKYTLDLDDLRKRFDRRSKVLVFCNPHNPTGRVWTKDDLQKVGELCLNNKCIIISDEIHCDVVYPPHKHYVFAQISKELAQSTVTFWSASKTYNVPGLLTAVAIIPNKKLRERFLRMQMGESGGNLLGYIALEACYKKGRDYKEQLIRYVKGNVDYFTNHAKECWPEMKVTNPEGTYMAWVDMRGLGLAHDELNDLLINQCKLALSDGKLFGDRYEGFQRFNLACPRTYVEDAIHRMDRYF